MMRGPTNSATRAAAAEAHADHAEAALAVCLQQPSFRGPDVRVVIRLLAVSKRLAALVARCSAGALALHTRVNKHPDALAAWLSHHGALLAELELGMGYCGHPAVRVVEQLPSSLTHLTLKGWDTDEVAAQQAAAFVRALSRQSMQLRSLGLPDSWHDQAATLLPALAALRHLTSLVMWVAVNDVGQLPVHHLPAQLQQLEVLGGDCSSSALPWLALEHVTGLTRLSMGVSVDGGVLPCGLRSLAVASVSSAAPFQPLEQLMALQLRDYNSDITSAEQLRQLSTLRRLEQLSVRTLDYHRENEWSTALAALAVLPLTHLAVEYHKLTAASLARLGDCTRLTSLELLSFHLAADGATPEQLAAAVARLTALERVQLLNEASATADADGCWAPVGKALAQLPRLTDCHLVLPVLGAAAAHLAAATQLTELHVCSGDLDDGCLSTICAGLTALRHLDVRANRLLTDACLACVAAMPRLMLLDVRYTGVTDNGVQQLCAARPSLQVQRR